MRVLVTGASGFVGKHLLPELRGAGHEPVVLAADEANRVPGAECAVADIRHAVALRDAVELLRPDACIHLAGQAHVPTAWERPAETMDINVTGTLNLLETLRKQNAAARFLFISTAEVYGRNTSPRMLDEDAPLQPDSLYGVSKAAGDMACRACARQHGMAVMVARPQNHFGPGQSPQFAAAGFARQISEMMRDPALPRRLQVGNLHSERDFTDVRDVARAYRMLLEHGTAGRVYNIGSGRNRRIGELVDGLCHVAGFEVERVVHAPFYRPTEIPAVIDTRRIQMEIRWKPVIPFEQTLRDLLASFS